jgi:hypothetical protein
MSIKLFGAATLYSTLYGVLMMLEDKNGAHNFFFGFAPCVSKGK